MANSKLKVICNGATRVFMAVTTCIVALGGASVGIVAGTIKGPTVETGIVRGACVGAITGAITALQLMDMIISGEPFSKVSFLCSLFNGQVFADWVSPALLKAYQWQISGTETDFADLFDGCENNGSKGLCEDSINKLPRFVFGNSCKKNKRFGSHDSNCAICLQDFKNREEGRELPNCRHMFHLICIDEWLVRNGYCPVCRRNV
ncbi:NEP1-interacting protein 2-like [Bidens hawaiensis]|uniref:NEP1-interacting protein 2-like n=1 Tax=Bidens hawaiensis TaxID=980011 RepID=UPI00404A1E6E